MSDSIPRGAVEEPAAAPSGPAARLTLSVVIPALNEERGIDAILQRVLSQRAELARADPEADGLFVGSHVAGDVGDGEELVGVRAGRVRGHGGSFGL